MSPKSLKIAYTIQNVGGIDLERDVGDAVPVKYTLRGLKSAGHNVTCLIAGKQQVFGIDDINDPDNDWIAPVGFSSSRWFRLIERGIRVVQRKLNLAYFAHFDSLRFYDACLHVLPDYQLCHEHNGLFSVGTVRACRKLNKPYILTFSADPLFEMELIGRPLKGIHAKTAASAAQLTYDSARAILCVSEPAKQHLINRWGVSADKIHVMPNGVDLSLFGGEYDAPKIRRAWDLGDDPIVSFVGGFQPWHGIDLLVEAFAAILQVVPNARLLLIGDGPARPEVEEKMVELGVSERVIITGLLPQARVPEMLAVTDVSVIPYPKLPQELWFSPLKLYEAMAAGKAIVASRSGQIAEVLQDNETGILVEPGNVAQLSQTITDLLINPSERERLGRSARQQATENHSWESYINRLEEIYLSVL